MSYTNDITYMNEAFELAEMGRGSVSPNPLVGSVIVRDGEIVGRGYHHRAGSEHAEVLALRDAGERAQGATLYVTLEPCCHHGKTPPCTDAIVQSGIARVVTALPDPNPLVCGQGIACLHGTGIDVTSGLMEDRARKQNEVFLKFIQTGMPFITLKLAVTLDGRIAAFDGSSKWITGPEARKLVHSMRAWSDAVMVGSGTVLADNPSLTVRDAEGDNPMRVILDSHGRTSPDAAVVSNNTILCVLDSIDSAIRQTYELYNAEVWTFSDTQRKLPLTEVLSKLGKRNITSVLCEGGAQLATSLLREQLVDKLIYMISPKVIGQGIEAIGDIGIHTISEALELTDVTCEQCGQDIVITGYPRYNTCK